MDNRVAALRAIPQDSRAPRYFVPVCLYPHTRYRTRQGLSDLIGRFALDRCAHKIVVADHLLGLDYLVTGRYWNPELVFSRAHRQGAQVFRLIRKTARALSCRETMSLSYWDEVAGTADFQAFAQRIIAACGACAPFKSVVDGFVRARLARFAPGDAGAREVAAETDYILGEISMSVYCTEVLGYHTEVWEKPLAPDAPDPLGVLYGRHPEIVRQVCGKRTLERRLAFLYPA